MIMASSVACGGIVERGKVAAKHDAADLVFLYCDTVDRFGHRSVQARALRVIHAKDRRFIRAANAYDDEITRDKSVDPICPKCGGDDISVIDHPTKAGYSPICEYGECRHWQGCYITPESALASWGAANSTWPPLLSRLSEVGSGSLCVLSVASRIACLR